MRSENVSWGGLKSVVVHNLADGQQPRLAVVLCHGYGASATDLVGLAEPMLMTGPADLPVVMIFPGAPLDLARQGMPGGRAWWPIDLDRLVNRRTPEMAEKFRKACPEGLPAARDHLVSLLGEAGRHFGLSAEQFVLGGFSQGSMLATDVALRLKKRPAGLCILSGALINEEEWQRLAGERGALDVLQTHGNYDSILPIEWATPLRDLLNGAGASMDFYSFDGDHEIPLEAMHRLTHFVRDKATEKKAGGQGESA